MNNLYLVTHPECFHKNKLIPSTKNYFEGWYFKISNGIDVISFIPGINIDNRKLFLFYTNNNKKSFIFYKLSIF